MDKIRDLERSKSIRESCLLDVWGVLHCRTSTAVVGLPPGLPTTHFDVIVGIAGPDGVDSMGINIIVLK